MSGDPRSEALLALSRALVSKVPLQDTLQQVAEIAVASVEGADIAGLTLHGRNGLASTQVYTDPSAPGIDQAQYSSGRGPCLDAWRLGQIVRIDDLDANSSYPEFRDAALAHGLHSTYSSPLVAGDQSMGALNLYSRSVDGFTVADEGLTAELAAVASVVLANASAYWEAYELSEQMSEAMRSRAVIEQAKGVIMATMGCSPDEAFGVLRQQSQAENRKLNVIAHQIVDRQQRDRRA